MVRQQQAFHRVHFVLLWYLVMFFFSGMGATISSQCNFSVLPVYVKLFILEAPKASGFKLKKATFSSLTAAWQFMNEPDQWIISVYRNDDKDSFLVRKFYVYIN